MSRSNVFNASYDYDNGGLSVSTFIEHETIPIMEIAMNRFDSYMQTTVYFHDVNEINNMISALEHLKNSIADNKHDVVH